MIINWFGQTCFKIQGQASTLITDPLDKSCGLRIPRLAADVVTISRNNNNAQTVKGIIDQEPFIIDGPGEYEAKNIFIYGIPAAGQEKDGKAGSQNIIYRIEMEGITIAHLGFLDHVIENGEIEKLEGTDILILPVGGGDTINAKQATEIISQLEPRIVIPMYYSLPGLKLKNKIDDVKIFCKEFGACPREEINKFKITKKDLPQEDLKVIVLQP